MEKKNNNKGFSLVELIVVVLIMAIIAVALAPQVMKWVENSRQANDLQTFDSLVANCQLALADKDAFAEFTGTSGTELTMTWKGGTTPTKLSAAGHTDFIAAMNDINPDWDDVVPKSSTFEGEIKISTDGIVSSEVKSDISDDLK